MYEHDIFSLFETTKEFIHALGIFKIHLHKSGPLKLTKTMLKSFCVVLNSFPIWNRYPRGGHTKGATGRSIIAYD